MDAGKARVAIVTGAAQGIGRALARRFVADGYSVVVADLNTKKGAIVANELVAAGGNATFVEADVSDEASCFAMVDAARIAFGSVSVLINNAGLANLPRVSIWELSVSEWDRVMGVNARGVWLATKAAVPALRTNGGGSIVNMSSTTWLHGRPGLAHYAASKAAVVAITRTAARELGPFNIRVNCIMPGFTITDERREQGFNEEFVAELIEDQSIKLQATPEDIVGAAAFLASDDARFISGQSLNVDGGYAFH